MHLVLVFSSPTFFNLKSRYSIQPVFFVVKASVWLPSVVFLEVHISFVFQVLLLGLETLVHSQKIRGIPYWGAG